MKTLIKCFFTTALMAFCLNAAAVNLKPAPDFALKDASGKVHTLKDYQGKPLVIQFWATWCPYCKKLEPGLNKIYNKFKDANGNHKIQVIGISYREDKDANPQTSANQSKNRLPYVSQRSIGSKSLRRENHTNNLFYN